MKKAILIGGMLLASMALLPAASAREEITVDASGPFDEGETVCLPGTQDQNVGAGVTTPEIKQRIFFASQEETAGGGSVFVPGVVVTIGGEDHQIGGEDKDIPEKTITTPEIDHTVGPYKVDEEVQQTVPGVGICAILPSS